MSTDTDTLITRDQMRRDQMQQDDLFGGAA